MTFVRKDVRSKGRLFQSDVCSEVLFLYMLMRCWLSRHFIRTSVAIPPVLNIKRFFSNKRPFDQTSRSNKRRFERSPYQQKASSKRPSNKRFLNKRFSRGCSNHIFIRKQFYGYSPAPCLRSYVAVMLCSARHALDSERADFDNSYGRSWTRCNTSRCLLSLTPFEIVYAWGFVAFFQLILLVQKLGIRCDALHCFSCLAHISPVDVLLATRFS